MHFEFPYYPKSTKGQETQMDGDGSSRIKELFHDFQ